MRRLQGESLENDQTYEAEGGTMVSGILIGCDLKVPL